MRRRSRFGVAVVALLSAVAIPPMVASVGDLFVGSFSDAEPGAVPEGWDLVRFPSVPVATQYSLFEEAGQVVLRAVSQHSASLLMKEVEVDLDQYPHLHWSWRTDGTCVAGSWQRPEADDFPLRLFVLFEDSGGLLSFFGKLGSRLSGDAVLYVSYTIDPDDSDRSSHLSSRIKVVPLMPADGPNAWSRPVRNLRRDYVDLFGREPPAVSAVAIMSDTDNTQTECVSYFGDIYFSAAGV